MYCPACGNEVKDERFCPVCGHDLKNNQSNDQNENNSYTQQGQATYVITDKSEGIAAVLSLLICGLGQIYVGKILRGIGFFVLNIVVCTVLFLFWAAVVSSGSVNSVDGAFILMIIFGIAELAFWIYNIFDAYNLAKEYNQYVCQYHKKPW